MFKKDLFIFTQFYNLNNKFADFKQSKRSKSKTILTPHSANSHYIYTNVTFYCQFELKTNSNIESKSA